MPSYLVRVAAKSNKVDFANVPRRMSEDKRAQFEHNRKTIFKDYQLVQAPNKDAAITKVLQQKRRIRPEEKVHFKHPCRKRNQCSKGLKLDLADYKFDPKDFSIF
jgi:hypothetical protein